MDDVSVVVVTYNSAADIERCFRALPRDVPVVVVDNASTDGTVALVRGATVIALDENVGFGAGCNRGAAEVDTRFVLFLNPDATIDEANLTTLVGYARAHPSVAMCAPALVDGDGMPMSASGDLPTWRTELRYALPPRFAGRFRDRRHPPDRPTGTVDVVEGACMLVDRAAFDEVGRFDEQFFLFFEEADLARRLRRAGREVHLVAEAVAHHGVGASRQSSALGARPHYLASTVRYLRTWEGRWAAVVFVALAQLTFRSRARFGSLPADDARRLLAPLRFCANPQATARLRAPKRVFVAWSRQPRSAAVAELLGAECHVVTVGRHGQRALVPVRYAAQAASTAWHLAKTRPRVVVAMCPPLALGLLALAYAKLTGATVAIDAHTAAILRHGQVRRSIRFFDRQGCVLIVASDHIADHLAAHGVRRPTAIHDPMPALAATSRPSNSGNVVVPLGWAPDEPIGVVLDAARRRPDLAFVLTGRPKGPHAGAALPANVTKAGLLPKPDYDDLVGDAAVVVALTTRPFTMLRAGYEAVQARVPVVVSDTPTLRDYFGDAAVFARPDGDALSAAIDRVIAERDQRKAALDRLAADHARHQAEAVDELERRLTTRAAEAPPAG